MDRMTKRKPKPLESLEQTMAELSVVLFVLNADSFISMTNMIDGFLTVQKNPISYSESLLTESARQSFSTRFPNDITQLANFESRNKQFNF